MSLTVTREQGLFVVKVTSDPESYWPPLCQIIWNRSPKIPDLKENAKLDLHVRHHRTLGAVQILLGITDLFLMAEHGNNLSVSCMNWLGIVVLMSGIVSVLAEERPCRCLVFLSVVVNLVAAALALTSIGFYMTDMYLYGILRVALIILALLQIGINVSTSVFAMEALSHNKNKEDEDDEPLLKEDLMNSAEKGLHEIPLLIN